MCRLPGFLVLTVFLGVLMASAGAEDVTVSPSRPLVGQDVIFNVTGFTGVRYYDWYQGSDTSSPNQIIRLNSDGSVNNGAKLFPEAKIQPNGSLVIQNVTKQHAGNYTVFIQKFIGAFQKTVELTVSDPEPQSSGLSGGEIAAIVVGVTAACVAIFGAFFGIWKKNSNGEGE